MASGSATAEAALGPLTRLWFGLLDRLPVSDRVVFVLGFYLVSEVVYLGVAAAYFWLWRTDRLLDYRIQKKAAMPEPALIKKCIEDVCFRSAVARIPFLFLMYDGYTLLGMPPMRTPLPPLASVLAHWAFALVVNDTLFYWTHRLMHHRVFYKRFHKKHHEFKVNVSVNSEYAELAEIVFCDLLPTIAGCALLGSHFLVQVAWLALRIWETCAAHSGYALPYCPFSQLALFNGPQVHDFHHSHNVGTYGAMTRFWDAVMGTDRQYQEHASRHPDPHIPTKPPLRALLPSFFPSSSSSSCCPPTPTTADSNSSTPTSSPASSPGRRSDSSASSSPSSKRAGRSSLSLTAVPIPSNSPIRARPDSADSLSSLSSAGSRAGVVKTRGRRRRGGAGGGGGAGVVEG